MIVETAGPGSVRYRPTRRRVGAGLVGLVLAGVAQAGPAVAASRPGPALPAGLARGATGVVSAVLAGDAFALQGGTEVRLAGVQAPEPARGEHPAWPLAAEATTASERALLGREVTLWHPADRFDRWGRSLAHAVRDDGLWLQAALLMDGLARVYTQPRTATGTVAMLDLERTARAARRGIWGNRFYRIRNPAETWGDLDSVQVVEGRVVDAAVVRGTAYLNFGPDWRRDFTFRAQPGVRRLFDRAGIDLGDLAGLRVRGRGWVFPLNGPMIELTHPEALEVLEE